MTDTKPKLEVLQTTCPLDCPDACRLEVQTLDGRIAKINGAKDDSFTDGFICRKVRHFDRHVYGVDRLHTPLKRIGSKSAATEDSRFEPISWDEALDTIANRLCHDRDTWGGESILPLCYGGSNGKLTQDTVDMRLFYRLGASHLDRTVCAAPTSAAYQGLYGKMPGVALSDYVHSRLIVIWGNNPHASGIHFVPFISEAQKRGAKLVVIDPRETKLASQADLHLPVFPGTDLPVALAMIRWLFDNGHADQDFLRQHTTGSGELLERAQEWSIEKASQVSRIQAADLTRFFEWYVETNPAVIRCGWGPERNRNGGSAVAAILAIPAVANKFGVRGAGFTMSNSGAWSLNSQSLIQASPPATRHINMNQIGNSLLNLADPPIKSLFVYNCNPLVTLPQQNLVLQGLQRDDLFTVVFDQVMTDTARLADIVLPATTFLEQDDLKSGYGYPRMADVVPVIEPVGKSRSNCEVFVELIERTGLSQEGDLVDPLEMKVALLGQSSFDKLQSNGRLEPSAGLTPLPMVDVQPKTPSGKIELVPESLERESSRGLYRYIEDADNGNNRFALVSPSTSKTVNSTLGQLIEGTAEFLMHPDDALACNLADGQMVQILNELGTVVARLKTDARLRPGVTEIPKGIWQKHTQNGQTSNALTPDTLSDIGQGACFNDARVTVAALP